MSLIIPCAGSSSRFPNMKPKWMLTTPKNKLMIQECIELIVLDKIKDIYLTFLKEHLDTYNLTNLEELFNFTGKKIHILLLDHKTKNQPETIVKTINHFNIQGPIFIKDCDNSFQCKIVPGNYICTLKIDDKNNVNKLYNKSFVQINELNEIINISEKNIISNYICIGGYSFENSETFINLFNDINHKNESLFISHLVFKAILQKINFKSYEVSNYHDWGTLDDWNQYKKDFKTLFIDIDGTLFHNSSEYFSPKWGESKPIIENINHIKKLYNQGNTQIILTTSRKEQYREKTIQQLMYHKIPYDNIIFNLYHCKRFLINDYSSTNPYPTAISINLERNDNKLKNLL